MSLKTNKLYILAGLLVASFMFLQSCEKKLEELSEGTLVEVDTDLLHTPGMVKFEDAKTGETLENVNVTFSGDDAMLLYSTSGKATLKPTDGFMDIGIDKLVEVSENAPFSFNIIANAPGYRTSEYSVVLTNVEPRMWVVSMVKLDDAPEGVTVSNNTFSAGANGVAQAITYQANAADETAPTITIPEGTKLLDANGNQVNGQAAFQMVYFDQNVDNIGDYQPDPNQLQFADGSIQEGYLPSVAYFDMQMKVGNTNIKSFSTPLIAKINIGSEYITSEAEETVKVGDVFSLWSIEAGSNMWVFENDYTIQEGTDGGLFVEAEISHFSGFTLAPASSFNLQAFICTTPYNLTISSDVPVFEDSLQYEYYSEIQYRYKWFFQSTFRYRTVSNWKNTTRFYRNGEKINVPCYIRYPFLEHRIKVYAGKRGCRGQLLTSSNWFRPRNNPTVNLNGIYRPENSQIENLLFSKVKLRVSALCDNITVRPTGYILMRLPDDDACDYQLQVLVKNGLVSFTPKNYLVGGEAATTDTKFDWKVIWNDESIEKLNMSTRDLAYEFYIGRENTQTGRDFTMEDVDDFFDNPEPISALSIPFIPLARFDLTQDECDNLTGG